METASLEARSCPGRSAGSDVSGLSGETQKPSESAARQTTEGAGFVIQEESLRLRMICPAAKAGNLNFSHLKWCSNLQHARRERPAILIARGDF